MTSSPSCRTVAPGLALALGLAFVAGPAGAQGAAPAPAGARQAAKDGMLLQSWIVGSFSSAAQAARDPAYPDMRLHVAPIWPAMSAAHWFYVEQAAAGRESTPERQRVHRLSLRDDGRFELAVFGLPSPSRFVGAWREPIETRLGQLTPDSLVRYDGCLISLRKQRDRFSGKTNGKGCPGTAGAAYVTHDIDVLPDRIVLLERRWDKAGKQLAGTKKAGTEYVRLPEETP